MRGESPLKGAAGRRIPAGAGNTGNTAGGAGAGYTIKNFVPPNAATAAPTAVSGPAPLPREIQYLLSVLPPAAQYNSVSFDAAKMVDFLKTVNLHANRS